MQFQVAWQDLVNKLSTWMNELILLLPNIVLAAIVMGFALLLSRYLNRYTNKLIYRMTNNQTISSVMSNIVVAAFTMIMLFIALGILNLDKALTSLLAGAGVVGLAIGLALQEPLVNLFSGVMMSVRKMYNVGDLVETNGYIGNIKEISLRSTILALATGEQVTLSNKEMLQNPLKNYSISGKRKIVIDCGVGYESDLDEVETIVLTAIEKICNSDKENIDFFYTSFGDSAINFRLRFWHHSHSQKQILSTKSKAIKAIKTAFDDHNISIPYPIRTLDIPREQLQTLKTGNYVHVN